MDVGVFRVREPPNMTVPQEVELRYLHPHGTVNEPVTLLERPITIPTTGDAKLNGTGALELRWLPSPSLRLKADVTSAWDTVLLPGKRVFVAIAGETAETLVSSTEFGAQNGVSFFKISGIVSTLSKGVREHLIHVGFQVVNFSNFLTPGS